MRVFLTACLIASVAVLPGCGQDPQAKAEVCKQVRELDSAVSGLGKGEDATTVGDLRAGLKQISAGLAEAKPDAGAVGDVVISTLESAVSSLDKKLAEKPATTKVSDMAGVKQATEAIQTAYGAVVNQFC